MHGDHAPESMVYPMHTLREFRALFVHGTVFVQYVTDQNNWQYKSINGSNDIVRHRPDVALKLVKQQLVAQSNYNQSGFSEWVN